MLHINVKLQNPSQKPKKMRTFKISYGLNHSGIKSFPIQVVISSGGLKINGKYPRLIFPVGLSVEMSGWDKKKGLPVDSDKAVKLLSLTDRISKDLDRYQKMDDEGIISSIEEIKQVVKRSIQVEIQKNYLGEKDEFMDNYLPRTEYHAIERLKQFDLRVIDRGGREIDLVKLFNWKYQDISDLYFEGKFELNGMNREDKYPIIFWQYIDLVASYKKKQVVQPLTNDAEYVKLRNKFKHFNPNLTLGQYNDFIGQEFLQFVLDNYEINTVGSLGSVIKILHAVLNYAIKYDKKTLPSGEKFVLDNVDLEDPMYDKQSEIVDNVYLTEENLKHLAEVKNLTSTQEYVRDLFVVGSYTAVRWSDIHQVFNIQEIKQGVYGISYKDEKTGTSGMIPVPDFIHDIVKKYNYTYTPITPKTFNQEIKEICKIAGMTKKYIYTKKNIRTGKIDTITDECFFDMVSAHTMKRSFATNMYIHRKLPKRVVMYFTHHGKEDTFDNYLKVKAQHYIDEYIDLFINQQ